MYKIIILPILSLLTGCSFISGKQKEKSTIVYLEDNIIFYQGKLSSEANVKVFDLYFKATIKPKIIAIDSGGGRVSPGMELGYWIFDNNISVIVDNFCYSSCANYVFSAANIKYLKRNSILGWHGGLTSTDWLGLEGMSKEEKEIFTKATSKKAEEETLFFKKIRVHQKVSTYGQLYNDKYADEGFQGYNYSIEDMEKFGITNIELLDGNWNWKGANKKGLTKRITVDSKNL